jgi:hypothetical protein
MRKTQAQLAANPPTANELRDHPRASRVLMASAWLIRLSWIGWKGVCNRPGGREPPLPKCPNRRLRSQIAGPTRWSCHRPDRPQPLPHLPNGKRLGAKWTECITRRDCSTLLFGKFRNFSQRLHDSPVSKGQSAPMEGRFVSSPVCARATSA